MELVAIIATVILLATLLTMLFSFAAYFVTRAKTFAKTKPKVIEETQGASAHRIYFERYLPESHAATHESPENVKSGEQWT